MEEGGDGAKRYGGKGTETKLGGGLEGGSYTMTREGSDSKVCKDKSDTETEAGGEAGISQSHLRYKKGHMTSMYRTDSDEEAIVNFVKDHKELYDNINDHFRDKVRKTCLWERLVNCLSLSV